ncbi:Uma2 family endonuclease [Sphingomonas sp. SUN019]|uniref:Uma2 family endonuclease n=1 Tax=Sphingomonas sp. SUN019 TaxID=2937788 RepID=UPI00216458C0|nr:Uma2 family endonuclease [Sphingomonas sp. SUN019]UVO49166.1 Uma2 family endonuclease [Sphingomonas sp. SUN019]
MTIQDRLPPGRYKLRVEDYLLLDEAGAFGDARTELIDGEIVIMNAEYRPHAWIKGELSYRLRRMLEQLGSDLHAMDGSVDLSDHDMPLPDIVLTDEPRGSGAIPLTSVALIVEVSSTTLRNDLGRKGEAYAGAGIAEYWVADVNARVIHQMWEPIDDAYTKSRVVAFGEVLQATTIDGLAIDTGAL